MKFIADAMLGRLAKWLRLLGFDVLYYPAIEDRQVIRIAREQERTILTRDTRLLKSKGARDAVFISSDNIFAQLREIKDMLDLNDQSLGTRCITCNKRLHAVVDRGEVRDLVPDYVYHKFDSFMRCDSCGKVYWEGSHYENIHERIMEILRGSIES